MFEESDYIVEHYIKPKKIGKRLVNSARGDILGNFDDDDIKFQKKKPKTKIAIDSEANPFADNDESEANEDGRDSECENDEDNEVNDDEMSDSAMDDEREKSESEPEADAGSEPEGHELETIPEESVKELSSKKQKPIKNKKTPKEKSVDNSLQPKTDLTDNQVQALIRGASKKDRYVLYVTNLNYSTTRDGLKDFFEVAGSVKSVRIPKVRKSAFAFVEMSDVDGFKVMQMVLIQFRISHSRGTLFILQNALALHNKTLDTYIIKIQVSEGGKKKSANKKNILKQKNRKLAEMRNEGKQFERSGKGYSKTIKRELKQQKMQIERRIARQQKQKALRGKK